MNDTTEITVSNMAAQNVSSAPSGLNWSNYFTGQVPTNGSNFEHDVFIGGHVGSHDGLTDAMTVHVHQASSQYSLLHSHVATTTIISALSLFLVVLALWIYCRRPYKQFLPSYKQLFTGEGDSGAYMYKPLAGEGLDEEYENTFVGVTVPILHDNTKV